MTDTATATTTAAATEPTAAKDSVAAESGEKTPPSSPMAVATKEATEAKSTEPETKGAEPTATVRRASAPRVALPRKL